MPQFILALDQGTTSSRSILFDADGTPVATAQREFTQHFPRSGWVEHDAEEIWATQAATIAEVLARARATPADVAAIGITNQRETTVLWDRAHRPAGRAGHRLAGPAHGRPRASSCKPKATSPRSRGARACCSIPTSPAPSSRGCSTAMPDARRRAERGELAFGTIDSWLVWKLSDGERHVTDVSNASRTLLLNIATAEWDDFMLELLRIPRAVLPRVVPSSLAGDAPVATLGGTRCRSRGIAGDQQAALFGQACFEPGMAKNTYGTGCFLLMNTGTAPLASQQPAADDHRLADDATCATRSRARCSSAAPSCSGCATGSASSSARPTSRRSRRSVPDTGGVYLVPAFTGLGSPHWDAYARGTMVGLSRGTTRAHIARAALEAIAFQSAEVLLAMQRDAHQPLLELRVDGGATANDLLMQFQADLLGVPVVRPQVTETTALGAAYLAGLRRGLLVVAGRTSRRTGGPSGASSPAMSRDEAALALARWAQAVDRSRNWHVES